MLTIFNWTESTQTHSLTRRELGLDPHMTYAFNEILTPGQSPKSLGEVLTVSQPPHSVRMLKIVDLKSRATPPEPTTTVPKEGNAGVTLAFGAIPATDSAPLLQVIWDFGDGVREEGAHVEHTFTHAGNYTVTILGIGIGSISKDKSVTIHIDGAVTTKFMPENKRRLTDSSQPAATPH